MIDILCLLLRDVKNIFGEFLCLCDLVVKNKQPQRHQDTKKHKESKINNRRLIFLFFYNATFS